MAEQPQSLTNALALILAARRVARTHEKTADVPQAASQFLQDLWTKGGPWEVARRGLIGTGIGAGGGAILGALNKDEKGRRKTWRHALRGALLGGALGAISPVAQTGVRWLTEQGPEQRYAEARARWKNQRAEWAAGRAPDPGPPPTPQSVMIPAEASPPTPQSATTPAAASPAAASSTNTPAASQKATPSTPTDPPAAATTAATPSSSGALPLAHRSRVLLSHLKNPDMSSLIQIPQAVVPLEHWIGAGVGAVGGGGLGEVISRNRFMRSLPRTLQSMEGDLGVTALSNALDDVPGRTERARRIGNDPARAWRGPDALTRQERTSLRDIAKRKGLVRNWKRSLILALLGLVAGAQVGPTREPVAP